MSSRFARWGLVVSVALAGPANGAGLFPPVLNVASLDGTIGFSIRGTEFDGYSGFCVCAAGDVNADGIDDVVIGAGRKGACVVFGKDIHVDGAFSASISWSGFDGANGFLITDSTKAPPFGLVVSSAGDINADGVDDLLVGNTSGGNEPGRACVVFGAAGLGTTGVFDLATLNGANGFVLVGPHGYDSFAASMAPAGDMNGDGIDDIVIGAPHATVNSYGERGAAFVVFGRRTSVDGAFPPVLNAGLFDGANGFAVIGMAGGDGCGGAVARAGDVNGDGVGDIVVGAGAARLEDQFEAGWAAVVFGKDTTVSGVFPAVLSVSSLQGTNGFVFRGDQQGAWTGAKVSGAGDLNGDGVDDVVIAAPLQSASEKFEVGVTYVVFGRDVDDDGPFPSSINASDTDGGIGFARVGEASTDRAGSAVGSAGDVNGDGINDLMIGAPDAGLTETGLCYVLYGKDTRIDGSFDAFGSLSDIDGTGGFVLAGIQGPDRFGFSVAPAGDVNHDGVDDVIIGAKTADPLHQRNAGETYIVFGRAPVVCGGDINGDSKTNVADFNILAGHFGQTVSPHTSGDLTGDGTLNVADFNILAGDFGCGH